MTKSQTDAPTLQERLRGDKIHWLTEVDVKLEAADAIDAHEATIVALVEALSVFAACADELDEETKETGREWPDDEWAKFRLLVSDYRNARAARALAGDKPRTKEQAE